MKCETINFEDITYEICTPEPDIKLLKKHFSQCRDFTHEEGVYPIPEVYPKEMKKIKELLQDHNISEEKYLDTFTYIIERFRFASDVVKNYSRKENNNHWKDMRNLIKAFNENAPEYPIEIKFIFKTGVVSMKSSMFVFRICTWLFSSKKYRDLVKNYDSLNEQVARNAKQGNKKNALRTFNREIAWGLWNLIKAENLFPKDSQNKRFQFIGKVLICATLLDEEEFETPLETHIDQLLRPYLNIK